ncbi:MAG: terminase TerL endonuclease subunit [Parvularculaceae bacterium]
MSIDLETYGRAAIRYASAVVADEVPACKWIKLAAKATLEDFAREQEEAFPWRFDHARAWRAGAFIEALPHVKGGWAARGERMRLEPWQVWIIASLFGWVRKDTGRRRYRRALILVPRKNGKSLFAAAIGLYMLAGDGEHGAEVYAGATSEKQAYEVFRPARAMALKTPRMCDRFSLEVAAKGIVSIENGARFEPLIGKPGDGASPSCAIVDEYHEHADDALVETMRTGMGARDEPLLLMISTAGDSIGGPCFQAMLDARRILEGNERDDALFAALYGLDDEDDWTAEEALTKANPNFGVSVSTDFLKQEREDALANARRQAVFQTKHLNRWVGSRAAFFNMENWRRGSRADLALDRLAGTPCTIGLDLASKSDLAAIGLVFPRDDGTHAVFAQCYAPEDALRGPNGQRYRGYAAEKRLILAEGAMIDHDRIGDDLRAMLRRFAVAKIAFDPWNATALITRLMAEGAPVIEFRQTTQNFSEGMKLLAAAIDDGRIVHDGDACLAWQIGNVTARADAADNVFPRKESSESKIDAAIAVIQAYCVALADGAAASLPYVGSTAT